MHAVIFRYAQRSWHQARYQGIKVSRYQMWDGALLHTSVIEHTTHASRCFHKSRKSTSKVMTRLKMITLTHDMSSFLCHRDLNAVSARFRNVYSCRKSMIPR